MRSRADPPENCHLLTEKIAKSLSNFVGKKKTIFGNFFDKNVKFLAIFHSQMAIFRRVRSGADQWVLTIHDPQSLYSSANQPMMKFLIIFVCVWDILFVVKTLLLWSKLASLIFKNRLLINELMGLWNIFLYDIFRTFILSWFNKKLICMSPQSLYQVFTVCEL